MGVNRKAFSLYFHFKEILCLGFRISFFADIIPFFLAQFRSGSETNACLFKNYKLKENFFLIPKSFNLLFMVFRTLQCKQLGTNPPTDRVFALK
jgi:hypothetical protein